MGNTEAKEIGKLPFRLFSGSPQDRFPNPPDCPKKDAYRKQDNLGRICACDYGIDALSDPVGIGESFVYQGCDPKSHRPVALKIFKDLSRPVAVKNLMVYREITDEAAKILDRRLVALKTVSGNDLYFKWAVNPISWIGYCDAFPASISAFIPGNSLQEKAKQIGLVKKPLLTELFLVSLNLNRYFGARHINLLSGNIKVLDDWLVITDLCSSIRKLRVSGD